MRLGTSGLVNANTTPRNDAALATLMERAVSDAGAI